MHTFTLPRVSHATAARAIIRGVFGLKAHVRHLVVTSDKAASVMKARRCTVKFVTTAAAASATSVLPVDLSTGASPADLIAVIPSDGTAPFTKTIAGGGVAANAITVTGTLGADVPAGSEVWVVKDHDQYAVGNATVTRGPVGDGGAVFMSTPGAPLVLELDGTAACSIDQASGVYE